MEWIPATLLALAGALGGAVIGFLLHERRSRTQIAQWQTARALAEQQAAQLQQQIEQSSAELKQARGDLATAREDSATARAERDAARQQLEEQKQAQTTALTQMRDAFAALSQEALKTNNDAFLSLAAARFEQLSTQASGTLDERKAQIELLLKPLQESLTTYQRQLGDIEQSRQDGYGKLMEQLGSVGEIGRNLERQTTQLVGALRRPSTRGRWGEITLRRLVELAGMSDHCDFTEQASVETEDFRQRPDMIVHLPNKRTIIIDSKAPLDKFLDAAACEDESQRITLLDAHATHLRGRARELAQRGYWNQFDESPDFVVMFLPGEAFLYAAVERDGSVIEDAMKDRVIIATPTTLIALLKAVELGWRQESITRNAEQIRELGVELYDRIALVASHLGALGDKLRGSVQAYNTAVGSFSSRLEVTARKFGEFGARSDRDIETPEMLEVQPRLFIAEAETPI